MMKFASGKMIPACGQNLHRSAISITDHDPRLVEVRTVRHQCYMRWHDYWQTSNLR